jgi:hypothetical protein
MLHWVSAAGQDLVPQSAVAMVTIVIGRDYADTWQRAARPSWERYAQRCGFDIVVIQAPFDVHDQRSPAWQKCLVLSQPWSARFDSVVWVDADIVINEGAPNILDSVTDRTRVAATLANDQLSVAERHILIERVLKRPVPAEQSEQVWQALQNDQYRRDGIVTGLGRMIATGVMVASPALHRPFFERAYGGVTGGKANEQPSLSFALLSADRFLQITPRYNWGLWDEAHMAHPQLLVAPIPGGLEPHLPFIHNVYRKAYFLHFYQMYHVFREVTAAPWPG